MRVDFDIKTVEKMFRDAEVVKNSPIREVRRAGDYFIKFDRRSSHGFAKEFTAAEKLQQTGLPVVNHLFHGKSDNGNYLVTGSFADSVQVDDYLRDNVPEMSFFEAIADLVKSMLSKGFLHTDFHLGNLLYNTVENSFALVDVKKVRSVPQWLLKKMSDRTKFYPLTEFRRVLKKRDLLKLFKRAGVSAPGEFYEEMLSADCEDRMAEWKRRRKQILSAYPKFTRKDGDLLVNVRATPDEIAAAEVIPGGKAVFLAGYFMDLIQIPSRKVTAYNTQTDTVYALPAGKIHAGGEAAIEMMDRASYYDIATAPEDWAHQYRGVPMLNSLEKVAVEPFILEE